jgi:hypothetical protein
MSQSNYYIEHLDEQLDAHGDITPPWAKFPDYERHTIGWRMGSGESWLCFLSVFLKRMGSDPQVREAYLRRHPPAPYTWASWVDSVLGEGDDDDDNDDNDNDDDDDDDDEMLTRLEARGLIAIDASYTCWCTQNPGPNWPGQGGDELVDVARHYTRELSFWSRQALAGSPRPSLPATIPDGWEPVVNVLRGAQPEPNLTHGLVTLAAFLARGWPPAPWACGLELDSFADSFDDDMGYADAFRLWLMSAFDDRPMLTRYLATQPAAPEAWREWLRQHVFLPGSATLD